MTSIQSNQNRTLASKRSHTLVSNSRTEYNQNSNDQSQYQIVIQFELRREKEKTRILQERLHNKQLFIQQMKQYQEDLTLAFEKCQQQLIISKKLIDQLQITEKDYLQEIGELKHLVIRLEDEINIREVNNANRFYSSAKKDKQQPQIKKRQTRSKTLMNYQQDSPKGLVGQMQEQVIKESKKISKFLKQFLMMTRCFCVQNENQKLKNKLKIAWKWIKDVVKQWNDLKNQKQVWDFFVVQAYQKAKIRPTHQLNHDLNKLLAIIQNR